jgi:hypothetical protein
MPAASRSGASSGISADLTQLVSEFDAFMTAQNRRVCLGDEGTNEGAFNHRLLTHGGWASELARELSAQAG